MCWQGGIPDVQAEEFEIGPDLRRVTVGSDLG